MTGLVSAREEESTLPGGAQSSCHCRLMDGVPEVVVAAYLLSSSATGQGMVTQPVTGAKAGWAGTIPVVHIHPHTVLGHQHKLCLPQVKAVGN